MFLKMDGTLHRQSTGHYGTGMGSIRVSHGVFGYSGSRFAPFAMGYQSVHTTRINNPSNLARIRKAIKRRNQQMGLLMQEAASRSRVNNCRGIGSATGNRTRV